LNNAWVQMMMESDGGRQGRRMVVFCGFGQGTGEQFSKGRLVLPSCAHAQETGVIKAC